MAKGISLHVGVNRPDPTAFSVPTLAGCVHDAEAMYAIAKARGFYKRRLLLDEQATFDNVTAAIRLAADELVSGDIFFFTFAGHGAQREDEDEFPSEVFDEAAVLYDYLLIDDYLRRGMWPLFESGVRVLMVADSCYSGTVSARTSVSISDAADYLPSGGSETTGEQDVSVAGGAPELERKISDAARFRHFGRELDFYEELFCDLLASPPIGASVLLLAACRDLDTTLDGSPHGQFTKALLAVWDGGKFGEDYLEFRTRIESQCNLSNRCQQPQLVPTGTTLTPTPFERLKPVFAI